MIKQIEGVTEGKYHPNNNQYIEGNMINVIPKKFLKDKIPTEEWAKSKLEDFKRFNPHFINYDNYV